MAVRTQEITLSSSGGLHAIDLSEQVARFLAAGGISEGLLTVFCPEPICAVLTREFEPGLLEDMGHLFERVAPARDAYRHNQRCRVDDGHAHLRADLLGSSVSVPFKDGRLLTGAGQAIVFVDFGIERTSRRVIMQVLGE